MPLDMQPPRDDSEIKVFISHQDSTCGECHEDLGHGAWITLAGEKGAICLTCSDLDHLLFLPTGDAALTRRARKYSTLSAVVLKFSRARKRYERQGLLVEEQGLAKAEAECVADADARERLRLRRAEQSEVEDRAYVEEFARRVRELFPNCPPGREREIAEHACLKYSGRVGRSASAKALDVQAVRLGVIAHIRHRETNYDTLLARGYDRFNARAEVAATVDRVLEKWRGECC